jgi:hypothetical protein
VTEADRKQAYVDAYERWQKDLQRLHRVLLDGEPLDPLHRVALLRSESHTHDRYEEARRLFLGLGPVPAGESPFTDEDQEDA